MIARCRFVRPALCLVCLALGCSKSESPVPLSLVVEGDPSVKAQVEGILRQNPEIVAPGKNIRYPIIVLKPGSNVDYKILRITPDPKIKYSIIIIDPNSGKELPDLSREVGAALRAKLADTLEPQTSKD